MSVTHLVIPNFHPHVRAKCSPNSKAVHLKPVKTARGQLKTPSFGTSAHTHNTYIQATFTHKPIPSPTPTPTSPRTYRYAHTQTFTLTLHSNTSPFAHVSMCDSDAKTQWRCQRPVPQHLCLWTSLDHSTKALTPFNHAMYSRCSLSDALASMKSQTSSPIPISARYSSNASCSLSSRSSNSGPL